MQTTVDIPDELYRQADLTAAQEGIPLRDLIAQGLRLALGKPYVASGQRVAFPLLHSARPGTLGVEEVLAAEEVAAKQEDAARAGAL
jgi:hypothetical protein